MPLLKPLSRYTSGIRGRIVTHTYTVPFNGPCTPETQRCKSAKKAKDRTSECCKEWNIQILRDVVGGLDEVEANWFIDYGTLLGFLVNGGLYWNDKDTDVSVLVEERHKIMPLREVWESLGYDVVYWPMRDSYYEYGDILKVRLSKMNKTNCDITFWHRAEDGLLDRKCWSPSDRYKGREMPESWIFPTVYGEWEGIPVRVPAQAERLIAYRYGKRWRNLPPVRYVKRERSGYRETRMAIVD